MERKELLLEKLKNTRTKLLVFSLSGILLWTSSIFMPENRILSFISLAIAVFYWRKIDELTRILENKD
ncbi:hypothetical protein SAMN06269117_12713 [Balnearium lithotrophicum]|uniref:Uncharacterized protein n=1 Tax=Balnearium lithotrophicum TaxID=223788 RepID=A0A521DWU8_9BACT|nr:hypothetical protein [Balnearium lithotrophicum]SMO76078.1 hypothetical protein SAMN06269117_12713 [Balnearium lithotrophicum]